MSDRKLQFTTVIPASPPSWQDLAALVVMAMIQVPFTGLVFARMPEHAGICLLPALPPLIVTIVALLHFVKCEWRRPVIAPTAGQPFDADGPRPEKPVTWNYAAVLLLVIVFAMTFGDLFVWLVKGTNNFAHQANFEAGIQPMPAGSALAAFMFLSNASLLANKHWATLFARVAMAFCAALPAVAMFVRLFSRLAVLHAHHSIYPLVPLLAGGITLSLVAKAWLWGNVIRFARLRFQTT